jgi:hypothetical protein
MTSVIDGLQNERGTALIEVYGHSGGGSLAVLIAPRLQGVARVVTLAGNLDTEAWTRYHAYSPLRGSLNPVRQGMLPVHILQLHLAGSADRTVPEWLIRRSAPLLGNGEFRILQNVSHASGWQQHWPAVLAGLRVDPGSRQAALP